MRLTPEEISSIRACAAQVFGAACTVRLFGSRVYDARRGGDIDLHVVAEVAALATVRNEIAFVLALEEAIGEQRVDVIARAPGFTLQPIDETALRTGVVLT